MNVLYSNNYKGDWGFVKEFNTKGLTTTKIVEEAYKDKHIKLHNPFTSISYPHWKEIDYDTAKIYFNNTEENWTVKFESRYCSKVCQLVTSRVKLKEHFINLDLTAEGTLFMQWNTYNGLEYASILARPYKAYAIQDIDKEIKIFNKVGKYNE